MLTDNRMPQMSGLELGEKIKSRNPAQPIIVLTGFFPPVSAEFPATGSYLLVVTTSSFVL